MKKICKECKQEKHLDNFYTAKGYHNGDCKVCEKFKRKLRKLNKAPNKTYESMLKSQNNKCKICGSTDPGHNSESFCIDHCHSAGHIRGLLCHSCNLGLGNFKDNIDSLQKAIKYLTNYSK